MAKIAFLFAGQGSQKIGMAKEFYDNIPSVKSMMDGIEKMRSGTLHQMWDGSIEELSQTINTQPCLFASGYAVAIALKEAGITPDAVAGFSVGEFPAMAVAEVLSLEDAFNIVVNRAIFMHECTENMGTSMASIMKLGAAEIEKMCEDYKNVYPANYNTKYQTVISGDGEEIDDFIVKAKKKKASAVRLKTSGAFHSPYMKNAKKKMEEYLKNINFSKPSCDVYSNVTGEIYHDDEYANLLHEQVISPVLWEKTIHNMIEDGVDTFIEMGVGKVLTRMIKKIVKDEEKYHDINLSTFYIENMDDLKDVINNVVG